MEPVDLLRSVELFEGLTTEELEAIGAICGRDTFQSGDIITREGKAGHRLFIVYEGFVEITRQSRKPNSKPQAVVNLGKGQIFGEMALVDLGPRSATVRAVSASTELFIINRDAFLNLCDHNHHLGYIVMRNIAADLSFKLRHRNLVAR